jgi:hypothetical protein
MTTPRQQPGPEWMAAYQKLKEQLARGPKGFGPHPQKEEEEELIATISDSGMPLFSN